MSGPGWDRREFLGGVALFALAVGVPAATLRLSDLEAADQPSERQRAMIRDVAQRVIPRTETAGAGEIGVGAFVALALAHGLDGTRDRVASAASSAWGLAEFTRRDRSLDYLGWLERRLDRAAGGDWLRRPTADQARIVSTLDSEAFPPGPPPTDPSPWRKIKGLILTGYYTSQTGGAEELRYELDPGRFDPNLPLQPADRAWSSDWIAVEFG